MAQLRFSVPNTEAFDAKIWKTAYLTGIEGIPWLSNHAISANQFSIGRQIDESGKLNIIWPSHIFGNTCLSTTSLRITEEPYSLPIEIARGTVYRMKSQAEEWQRVGLRTSADYQSIAEQALNELLQGLTSSESPHLQLQHAQRAIDLALEASVILTNTFSTQALEARKNNEGRLATLLGCSLPTQVDLSVQGEALRTAFNLVSVSADFGSVERANGGKDFSSFDAQVEWANKNDQRLCIGPMVDFRRGHLPQWMTLLDDSYDNILSASCQHVQTVVDRYRGRVHLWNCATGINVPNGLGWNDEEILRLAVSVIETARRADSRTPVLLTIDQPWSEYLRDDPNGISPLHFADALIRADLGLNGLALELNFDRFPDGSFPRDPLEVNHLIDRWAMLGLPLMVILSMPTERCLADPARISNWPTSLSNGQSGEEDHSAGIPDPNAFLRLLLSKPSVHAVIWKSFDGDGPSQNACDGLWQVDGKAKPILTHMAKLRKTCLH